MQPSDLFVMAKKAERSVKEHLCVHRPCFGTHFWRLLSRLERIRVFSGSSAAHFVPYVVALCACGKCCERVDFSFSARASRREQTTRCCPHRLFYCTIAVFCFVFAAVRSRRPEKAKRPTYACMTAGSCRCLSHPDQRALLRPFGDFFILLSFSLVCQSLRLFSFLHVVRLPQIYEKVAEVKVSETPTMGV